MTISQYTIPLEETEDGTEPVYDYPEEEVDGEYRQDRWLKITLEEVIPHFHKNSVRVGVDVLTGVDAESQ